MKKLVMVFLALLPHLAYAESGASAIPGQSIVAETPVQERRQDADYPEFRLLERRGEDEQASRAQPDSNEIKSYLPVSSERQQHYDPLEASGDDGTAAPVPIRRMHASAPDTDVTEGGLIQAAAAPLPVLELPQDPRHASELDTIRTETDDLTRLQQGMQGDAPVTIAQMQEVQQKLQILRSKVRNLRAELGRAVVVAPASEAPTAMASKTQFASDATAKDPAYIDDLIDRIATLDAELKDREALIQQLIAILAERGTSPTAPEPALDPSLVEGSLLAIEEYPTAASGIALFILVMLFLFRGRLAELSGFGVRMRFRQQIERAEKKDEEASKKEDEHLPL